jgi:hypothetical protein
MNVVPSTNVTLLPPLRTPVLSPLNTQGDDITGLLPWLHAAAAGTDVRSLLTHC